MNRTIKILAFLSSMLFAQDDMLAPDISFIDLPFNAKSGSLGNTYLSDIGSPSNILLNPANIWFGDDIVTNKNHRLKNIYTKLNISNLSFLEDDNVFNLMFSSQFGDKITFGFGYVENSQTNINNYDQNANYLGNIEYKQSAASVGFASKFSGINIGVSATMFNNNFMDSNEESISENELQLITSGISLNNIYLKKGSAPNSFLPKMIYRLIPNTISFQMTSRILYYEDISNNSTSKSVYGVKAEYNKPFNRKNDAMYFLYDFNSNNDVSDNIANIGTGYTMNFKKLNTSIGFNAGINDFGNNNNISYGLELIIHSDYDFSISFSNQTTSWNSDLTMVSFKLSRRYKN